MAYVIGASSSRAVWTALDSAFNHGSKTHELWLRDDLQTMKKGTRSVPEFGRQFQNTCDQLAAMGCPIDESDKTHWFLRGLRSSFASISAVMMAQRPFPKFADLLSEAESFSLFSAGLDTGGAPSTVFVAQPTANPSPAVNIAQCSSANSGNSRSSSASSKGSKYSKGRRPPRCQLCRAEGHYANNCPQFVSTIRTNTGNLAEAFQAGCSLGTTSPSDWFVDTRASAHMTQSPGALSDPQPFSESSNSRSNC